MKSNYLKGLLLAFLTLLSVNDTIAQCVLSAYAQNITANCGTGVQTYDVVVEFSGKPSTGNLRLRNSSGNITTAAVGTIGATTYTFTGVTFNMSLGEQNVYVDFSADTNCRKYIHVPLYECTTYPTNSTAGTYGATVTNGKKYTSSGSDEYVLNYNGDLTLRHNNNHLAAFKKSIFENVEYFFYTCKPSASVHPFLSKCSVIDNTGKFATYTSNIPAFPNPDMKEISLGDNSDLIGFYANTFTENKVWVMPSVYDSFGSDISIPANYFANAAPFSIQYLNQITATKAENCGSGSITFSSLFGGYPEFHASNYTITNNATGTLSTTSVALNGSFSLTGLTNGATYNVTITDVNGGQTVLSGTFCSSVSTTDCGSCATPTCPVGFDTNINDAIGFTQCNNTVDGILPITNKTITYLYTVSSSANGTLGFVQRLNTLLACKGSIAEQNTFANRTYALYALGNCNGTAIVATTPNAGHSTTLNPEWTGLTPNTNYILKVTVPITSCGVVYTCTDYYHPAVATNCSTCATPSCTPTSITATTLANGRTNISTALATAGNVLNRSLTPGQSVTICVPVTVPSGSTALGFKQNIDVSLAGCGHPTEQVITYTLKPVNCTGSGITPTRTNASSVSSGFNPEWDNIAAGDYVLCYTMNFTSFALCNTVDINGLGYYNIIPTCVNPATPTVTSVAATCSAAGTSTISNYSASNTYTFLPAGPTVGAGGVISGMTTGTSYTVRASVSTCNSAASTSFSNAAILPTPAVPTITSGAATCSVAGTSTISNYNAANTYTFSPTGPTVGAGGAISGMTTGTSYTVTAKLGSCTSTASSAFSNTATLPTPAVPTITSGAATCSAAGTSTISNYNASYTYTLLPAGPTVGAGGTISGMTTGTSYTVTAKLGSCTSTASTAFNNAAALTKPTATVSGTTSICNGASANLSVVLTGSQPWSITYTDGTTPVTVNNITSSPYSISVSPSSTKTYSITTVSDSKCTGTTSGSAVITVNAKPTATISGGTTICNGNSTNLSIALTGTQPWSVTYLEGATSKTITATSSPYVLAAAPNITTTYTLVSVSDSKCNNTASGSTIVSVTPKTPVAINCGVSTVSSVSFTWSNITDAIGYNYIYTVNGGAATTGSLAVGTTNFAVSGLSAGDTVSLTVTPIGSACGTAGTTNCVASNCPNPIVNAISNIKLCGTNKTLPIQFTSPTSGVTFNWSNNNPSIGLAASGTGNTIPSFTLANVATTQVATISVTASDGPCTGPVRTFTITVEPTVVPTFSVATTICSGDTFNLPTTSNEGVDGIWTPAFDNANTNEYTFTPTSNPCAESVKLTITVNEKPAFTAITAVTPICSGQDAVFNFAGTANAEVTYKINGGADQNITLDGTGKNSITVFTPSSDVTVTVSNINLGTCPAIVSDSKTVVVNATPTFTAITAVSPICSGENAVFTLEGTPNSTVNYTTDSGATTQSVVLNGAGTNTITVNNATSDVTVTLTSIVSGTCSTSLTDTKTVVVNTTPTVVSMTSNSPICSGANAVFTITGTPNATVTYDQDTNLGLTLTLDASGNGTITVNNPTADVTVTLNKTNLNTCETLLTNSEKVVVNPTPIFSTLTDNSPVCSGNDVVFTIEGTPNSTVAYTLDNGVTTQNITLDGTGKNTVTVSNTATDVTLSLSEIALGTCKTNLSVSKTATVNATPEVTSVTSNSPICSGNNALFTITGTANATVTYKVDAGVDEFVTLDASGNATVTVNNPSADVTIALSNVNLNSCDKVLTNTTTVIVNPTPSFVALTATSPICSGNDAVFNLEGTANATVTYTSNGGATTETITLDGTGKNAITITNVTSDVTVTLSEIKLGACSAIITDTKTVNVNTTPSVTNVTSNSPICAGNNAIFTITGTANATVTYKVNAGVDEFVTLDASGNATVTVNNPTADVTITLGAINLGTCNKVVSNTAKVVVNALATVGSVTPKSVAVCSGDTASFDITGTANATITYTIDSGANQTKQLDNNGKATIDVSNAAANVTITITEITINGCNNVLTGVNATVTVNTRPTATLSGSSTICKGNNGSIAIAFTGAQPWNVTYKEGSTNVTVNGVTTSPYIITINPLNNTTYTLVNVNDVNCTGTVSGSAVITVNNPSVTLASDCIDSDFVLTATASETAGTTYVWYKGSTVLSETTNKLVVTATDTYKVEITNNGCKAEASEVITSFYCDIPKGISPNDDDKNNFFDLSNLHVENLQIFNRYGMEVYSKSNYKKEWKGQTNDGTELPDGTYYYIIQFESGKTKTGWVYKNSAR